MGAFVSWERSLRETVSSWGREVLLSGVGFLESSRHSRRGGSGAVERWRRLRRPGQAVRNAQAMEGEAQERAGAGPRRRKRPSPYAHALCAAAPQVVSAETYP